ncbi:hypothetical protein OTB20_12205 [Streptomyces sp. H27-H1]|uniref:hypothetical protein n=1 Tax=unclassified Streptomyces TaxID=2593676 RepID=UPI00226E0BFC|nr:MULTISPECIES: hypothetical protein [unclassified Streptomyces]MCY0926951.1 hypothetical protein [Streptomyces sp. H27-H1]MCY0933215.1 hypothetical protein [Streptomyces sp. H34-S4]
MIDFLKAHQALFTLLLTLLAAFGGTWLASKIQASAGLAQAKAAMEAAETAAAATLGAVREQADRTAEAAHFTVLRDQRSAAVTGLLRTVRAYTRAVNRLYAHSDAGGVDQAHDDFIYAQAIVEIVAPANLVSAGARVVETAQDIAEAADRRSAAARAQSKLNQIENLTNANVSRANAALAALRASCQAADDGYLTPQHREVTAILCEISELDSADRAELVIDCLMPSLASHRGRLNRRHEEALGAFILEARTTLGVID